jgi:hypothetical protein
MRNHALDPANWLAKLQSLKPSCAVPANSGVNTFKKDSEFRSGRHHPYMFILHCLLHDSLLGTYRIVAQTYSFSHYQPQQLLPSLDTFVQAGKKDIQPQA